MASVGDTTNPMYKNRRKEILKLHKLDRVLTVITGLLSVGSEYPYRADIRHPPYLIRAQDQ